MMFMQPRYHHFEPCFGFLPTSQIPAYWFVFQGATLLLTRAAENLIVPRSGVMPVPGDALIFSRLIGRYQGIDCIAVGCHSQWDSSTSGLEPVTMRQAPEHLGDDLWMIAGRASQLLHWHETHAFCGRCGNTMTETVDEAAKICTTCGTNVYPRLAPAVIMSVIRDDAILLGRAPRFQPGMYSTLAGFVEPGETLEGAVAREIYEEVGLEVTDITYVASQPWPFPHSLMIGFTCRHQHGEIKLNKAELEDAGWFTIDRMPRLPMRISIARLLIERFLDGHR